MNKNLLALSLGVVLAVGANAQNNNSQAVIPWKANGNQAAAEHFIGTINQTDLVFKANSLEMVRLLTDGNIKLEQLKLQSGDNTLDLPRVMVLKDDGTIRIVQGEELLKLITLDVPHALDCGPENTGDITYSATWRPKAGNPAQLYAYSQCGPVNVGINTDNPQHTLHVVGNSLVKGTQGFTTTGHEAIAYLGTTNHFIKAVNGLGLQLGTYQAPNALTIQQGNGFVGIGTTNSLSKLHIENNGNVRITLKDATHPTGRYFQIEQDKDLVSFNDNGTKQIMSLQLSSGNVGIGNVLTPQARLDIDGWISLGAGVAGDSGPASAAPSGRGGIYFPSTNNDFLRITSEHDGHDNSQLIFYTADNADDGVVFRNADCCGEPELDYLVINRANMNYCGIIRSKEIVVESNPNGWCDYVFEESYQRMTLEEKERYIKENKHLPMITPGAEIEEKGLNVGENMKGFVYNLENLTLDQIELYKMIQDLQKQQELLKQKVEQLEEENEKLKKK